MIAENLPTCQNKVIPDGVIGISGYPEQIARVERIHGALPKSIVSRCGRCGHEIRYFRGDPTLFKVRPPFSTGEVEVLPPGTKIKSCRGCSR